MAIYGNIENVDAVLLATVTAEAIHIKGADGITPHIGDNGNWYLGDTDTGKPSRGVAGAAGAPGKDGYTPVKGVDYWTASDKAEVVAEAAAAIDLTSYAKKTEVPTKTSQLTNDSEFLTSHQDISGKQDKSTLEADVAAKGFTKNTGTYSKPAGGIPKADLAAAVQTSLGKADTALQEHQSLAAYRTAAAQDVIDSSKVDKVTGKGLSSNDYTDAAKSKVDALAPVATSGSYNDLTDKPTIPAALPNPNALTFTGAVTGSYDGSAAKTVNIPSAVTDDHINSLIDTKLGVIENGSY